MRLSVSTLAIALLAPLVAQAQDPAPPATDPAATATTTVAPPAAADPLAKENWPTSAVDRPIGLSKGMLQLDLPINLSLNKGSEGNPVKIPLVIYYGVTNELQLALVHAGGVCVGSGCGGKAYNDVALNATYSLLGRGSSFELAAWMQLTAVTLDPMALAVALGPYINWVVAGNIAILSNPGIQIGITERPGGNKEFIGLPVTAYFRAGANLAPFLFTGIGGPLDGFGDFFSVPLGVGAVFALNAMLDFGLRFDIASLVQHGDPKPGIFDAKSVTVWASIRPL